MKYTDIIWDFNGTILDDVSAGILSVNKLLSDRGLPTICDKDYYRSVFTFPIIEYYRALGFDFDVEPYEVLAPLWVAEYLKNSKNSTLKEGFFEALESFACLGLRQHVLSATECSMLRKQLLELGIDTHFDSICGLDNIHASSKTALALRWRDEHPNAVPLFIGDTEHDFETAKAIGCDCALVCDGHQSKERLMSCEGAYLFDSLSDFLTSFVKKDGFGA